ncbi:MAG: peptidase S8, partial [Acidimicrobiia bacterium]
MRRFWAAGAVSVVMLAPVPALSAPPAGPSSYVVALAAGVADPDAVAAEQAAALGFTVSHVYR